MLVRWYNFSILIGDSKLSSTFSQEEEENALKWKCYGQGCAYFAAKVKLKLAWEKAETFRTHRKPCYRSEFSGLLLSFSNLVRDISCFKEPKMVKYRNQTWIIRAECQNPQNRLIQDVSIPIMNVNSHHLHASQDTRNTRAREDRGTAWQLKASIIKTLNEFNIWISL